VFMSGYFETISVIFLSHGLKPVCHPFSVTILTTGADLVASGSWIPCTFGPFDC
jgi:hypothetical protein